MEEELCINCEASEAVTNGFCSATCQLEYASLYVKKCSNCFKIKCVYEFYSRDQGDGYQSRCKDCNTEVCAGYRERNSHGSLQHRVSSTGGE